MNNFVPPIYTIDLDVLRAGISDVTVVDDPSEDAGFLFN